MQFHDEVNEAKVSHLKNIVLSQKKKRDLYNLYFKGQNDKGTILKNTKTSPKLRWKKALALQKIFSLKRDLVDILKRHPNIFKMSNIESTKKKIWDEFYSNVGKNKDTA